MTQIIEEVQLDYCDVMIKPKRSTLNSRSEPNVYRDYKFRWTNRIINGNGLMVANMATTGTFEMAKVMQKNKMFCCLQKHYTYEELKTFLEDNFNNPESCNNDYIFISTGIKTGDYENICKVIDLGLCKNLCIDVANGYIPNLLLFVKKIRENYPSLVIMVGNVVTGDMVQDLILTGADIVKCGIGQGANCTTRKETGCGRPQFSTVLECAEAAHAIDGMICADGGITCTGDICKAYGAGADFVMVGSLVAGTDEADGEIINKCYRTDEYSIVEEPDFMNNIISKPNLPQYKMLQYKLAYGMSSKFAQDKHWNGMNKYRTSEGIVTLKPYSGSVQDIIDNYLGGLRSCMTYISAKRLKDIPKCCTFYKTNRILNNDGKGIM